MRQDRFKATRPTFHFKCCRRTEPGSGPLFAEEKRDRVALGLRRTHQQPTDYSPLSLQPLCTPAPSICLYSSVLVHLIVLNVFFHGFLWKFSIIGAFCFFQLKAT